MTRGFVRFVSSKLRLTAEVHLSGDDDIQNFNLGRFIVGYMVGNNVLRFPSRVTVKLNF